jgi:hypothetical protein
LGSWGQGQPGLHSESLYREIECFGGLHECLCHRGSRSNSWTWRPTRRTYRTQHMVVLRAEIYSGDRAWTPSWVTGQDPDGVCRISVQVSLCPLYPRVPHSTLFPQPWKCSNVYAECLPWNAQQTWPHRVSLESVHIGSLRLAPAKILDSQEEGSASSAETTWFV